MASVHRRPKSKFWHGQFKGPNGRLIFRSTKSTNKLDAQRIADAWENAARMARRGELNQATMLELCDRFMKETLGIEAQRAAIGDWLDTWLEGRRVDGVADSTLARYKGVLKHFREYLGETRLKGGLGTLTALDVMAWMDGERKNGKAAKTLNVERGIVRNVLEDARRKGLVLSNVADAVDMARGASDERQPFTANELKQLYKAASVDWRGMILFGAHLGLRLADAAALTWRQVDLDAGTLTITPAKTRRIAPRPKMIALHPEITAHLKTLERSGGRLFPSLPTLSQRLSDAFTKLMEAAGVEAPLGHEKEGKGRQLRTKGFHSLRHTAISRMANAGTNADVRKEIAGHSSDDVHRRYTHLSLDAQRAALEVLPNVAG